MKPPTITDAKELATRLRQRRVLILTITESEAAISSYGMTRADCDAMRKVADQIMDMLEHGEIKA